MVNIDDKAISALLDRIGKMKSELEALEYEVRTIASAVASAPESTDGAPADITVEVMQEPIDLSIADIEPSAAVPAEEPVVEELTIAEPEPAPVNGTIPAEEDMPFSEEEDLPFDAPEQESAAVPEAAPVETVKPEIKETPKPKKAIVDSAKADNAVIDVMAEKQAWRTDRPGSPVKNIISAISLNDRVLLINVLFKEDPMLFQDTISAFNSMNSFDEAVAYVNANFAEWDLSCEPVYRLMMAVRRKLK